ncbi:MAG TPA: FAD-dependent oxidoreductase, partial [Actinomycetota bacterium]|nr:FAD-dependent oxidoreductase [Actinomycetota bacterium]
MKYLTEPPASAELVIIGGGVIGAATAFHATRAGLKPLLVEARPALCTLTTPVAAGAFRLQFDDLEELTLVRESAELFLNFREVTGQDEYDLRVRQQGYLWLTTDERNAERQRALVARLHEWGQGDVELLLGDEVRQRFPYVGENVVQARWRGDDGFLDTTRLTFGLIHGSRADVMVDCAVTGFVASGGRLTAVRTTKGIIPTGVAVVAAGPLSGLLAGAEGIDLPIVTVRRQKLILPEVAEVPPDAPMTIDEDTGVHWRPALAGAWLLFTDPTTPESPPADNVPIDPAFAFQLLDPTSPVSVARVVPFWREVWDRGAAPWLLQAGQYTMTPDHRP